jgi:hypothetical protein
MIRIRRCQASDVPDVLTFLDRHWKPRHVFTADRELFDWQYARPDRPGYLPTRRFDPALAGNNALWLALWKVRDDVAGPVGLQLLTDVANGEPHTSIGVIGFQPPAAAIYKALKFDVGELRHYVLVNPDVSTFELAVFATPQKRSVPDSELNAVPVDASSFSTTERLDLGTRSALAPQKTAEYFRRRFLLHPRYRYDSFVIQRKGHAIGLLATRVATHGGRRALRVVDYIGPSDAVPGLGRIILDEVRRVDAEYADVLNWGIDPALFSAGGFACIDPRGPDIVPNHFEPFERRNATVRFALKSDRPAVLFKGDGDQDRPNQRIAT